MDGSLLEFYRIMAAVLSANLLTGSFFWGLIRYTQREKEGREYDKGVGPYLIAMLLPLGYLAFAVFFMKII